MILTSSNFGAGCIKDSRDQKLKKTSAHSVSLRLCVKNLWDGSIYKYECPEVVIPERTGRARRS